MEADKKSIGGLGLKRDSERASERAYVILQRGLSGKGAFARTYGAEEDVDGRTRSPDGVRRECVAADAAAAADDGAK